MSQATGKIVQCIGAVVDIEFPREGMPNVYDALTLMEDSSEGGLAVALAEGCISQLSARKTPRLIGARVDLSSLSPTGGASDEATDKTEHTPPNRLDALLFGETQHRVVISCAELDSTKIVERARLMGVSALRIGTVGGSELSIKTAAGEFSAPAHDLHDGWWNSIARTMA